MEDKLDKLKNKIEIRLTSDVTLIVNGMADNKKIREMLGNIIKK